MAKRGRSFYLTEEAHEIIRQLSGESGLSNNAIVERAVRELGQLELDSPSDEKSGRIGDLKEDIDFLRRELEGRSEEIRRRDIIISQLAQRVPEIGAGEQRESRVRESKAETKQETEETSASPETDTQGPWWRRWLS